VRCTSGIPFTRPASCTSDSGFTLVEMLVVIVILGIVTGLGVALVGPDERDVQAREARRFASALEYAAARAQWRNEALGVSADGHVVRYWRRASDDRWTPLADDDVLAAHRLPDTLDAAALAFAGRTVAPNAILPLRASGRNEPLAFALVTPRYRTVIALDPLNRAAITGPSVVEP
jgi:type II secretion system protein H